ncbi:phage major capsid protein [Leuconostoc gasicomitatum]|uniref:phage major capsid protein n=1 Tax=Leuconostoc gasicomitatum TaxID=115778 RepID=UPI001CC675D4|nr:phage major capsid protein [Leuconostoc gasicomitatum]MBZ5958144.1 phage major capsid protein [Leuconostoc gasicomitatum]
MNKEQLEAAFRDASSKASDLNAKLNNMTIDDSSSTEDIKKTQDELAGVKTRRDVLNAQLKSFEDVEPEPKVEGKKTNILDNKIKNLKEKKIAINDFVHKNGVIQDASQQVSSTEVELLIPESIIYDPSAEVNSVVDLSILVTKVPVTTKSGKYPILKRATNRFHTVAELVANPALAAPEFQDVSWSVDTYRGEIPISEESIADAAVDVTGIVTQNIGEQKVNTYNQLIAPVLKQFTAKATATATLVDQIKHIINVDLDPAYRRVIIASQSFYNTADTLKDKNGRYLLQESSASVAQTAGKTLLGVPVFMVGDDLLGNAGEQVAFIGDLKRGILFTDRQQASLAWTDNHIYGRLLGGAFRFGVSQADANAGYFITNTDTAPAGDGK